MLLIFTWEYRSRRVRVKVLVKSKSDAVSRCSTESQDNHRSGAIISGGAGCGGICSHGLGVSDRSLWAGVALDGCDGVLHMAITLDILHNRISPPSTTTANASAALTSHGQPPTLAQHERCHAIVPRAHAPPAAAPPSRTGRRGKPHVRPPPRIACPARPLTRLRVRAHQPHGGLLRVAAQAVREGPDRAQRGRFAPPPPPCALRSAVPM